MNYGLKKATMNDHKNRTGFDYCTNSKHNNNVLRFKKVYN